MADENKKITITADLDEFEVELVASLFRDYITENREMARVEHAAGRKTADELKWHLGHADYVETIAKKFFPGWGGPARREYQCPSPSTRKHVRGQTLRFAPDNDACTHCYHCGEHIDDHS
jgi:hypothetical protein